MRLMKVMVPGVLALLVLASPCLAGIDGPPDGHWGDYRKLTQGWLTEFNKFRSEKGLPLFVWSEKMYAVLVEYTLDLKKVDAGMEEIPGAAQKPTPRARRVHRWNIHFFDNYTIWHKQSYDPAEVIKTYREASLLKSIWNPRNNAAAVAIVERNANEVYIIMATASIDIDDVLKARECLDLNRMILESPEAGSADRVSAMKELALRKNFELTPTLQYYITDRDPEVARLAIQGLSSMTDPSFTYPLIRALGVAHASVQDDIARALAKITGKKDYGTDKDKWLKWFEASGTSVAKPFEVPSEDVKLSADEINDLIEQFRMELDDPDVVRRIDAIKKVGRIRDKKIAKAICPALKDKEPTVRKTAAEALAYQAEKGTLKSLSAAFAINKSYPDVQAGIIRAMGAIGDYRSLPVITKNIMKPGEDDLTRARIEALGMIKHPESIQTLIDFMVRWRKGARQFRKPLNDSLEQLTGQKFGNNAGAWKDWWERNKKTFRFPR